MIVYKEKILSNIFKIFLLFKVNFYLIESFFFYSLIFLLLIILIINIAVIYILKLRIINIAVNLLIFKKMFLITYKIAYFFIIISIKLN
jgi:hypothetical protein